MAETAEHIRIHIGNISSNLAATPDHLTRRFVKFGEVVTPLELKTKPVNDFYFGYVTLNITPKNFNQLKKSLNNVLFMGMKLTVNKAKPSFEKTWIQDANRPDKEHNKDRVQWERQRRITEYQHKHHINTQTHQIVPMQISTGYNKSPHVCLDKSGETKNPTPKSTLIGSKSYGALTFPLKFYDQVYSISSGGSEIIRGRIRKTPRSTHALRHQTLRILVNDNLK